MRFHEDNYWRLSPTGNWRHNNNSEIPPEDTSFLVLRGYKKNDQSDCSHFIAKYISASLENVTFTSNFTTDLESKYLAIKNHQRTCASSKGGTGCGNYSVENTEDKNHITFGGEATNIPYLGSTFKSMVFFLKLRRYSILSKINIIKRHHGKFNINYGFLCATVVSISAPKQHITLLPTTCSN